MKVQFRLIGVVAEQLGVDLAAAASARVSARADQLALLGAVVMADWLASDARNFPGIGAIERMSMDGARERADAAWRTVGLRGGWDPSQLDDTGDS